MSKKTPVMSHDPLSGLDDEVAVSETAQEAVAPQQSAETEHDAVEVAAAGGPYVLPDSLTIADVGEVHKALIAWLEGDAELALDGGEVELVDGAGLQLLAALFKEAAAQQKALRWQAVSEALRQGAQDVGVSELLSLEASAA